MNNIGLSITYFREKKFPGHGGQKKAAEKLGIARTAWHRYEKADRLSLPILERIAKTLNVSVDDLITHSEGVTLKNLPGTKESPSGKLGDGKVAIGEEYHTTAMTCLRVSELLTRFAQCLLDEQSGKMEAADLDAFAESLQDLTRLAENFEMPNIPRQKDA